MNQETRKEDEYQFPNEDEYMSSADADTTSQENHVGRDGVDGNVFSDASQSISSKKGVIDKLKGIIIRYPVLNNKKFVLTILALFFSVIIFSFIKPASSSMHAVKPVATSSEKIAPRVVPQAQEYNTKVDSLSKQISAGSQETADLSDHIRELQVTVNQLTSQQNQLAAIISSQQKQIAALNKKIIDKKKSKYPVVTYKVKAIVPGRAWLVASDGTTITVAVGNTLPSYGKVLSINANSGVVMTSSHKEIVYGQADF